MANRVEYIKIARIDQNGNDLTNTLGALTQITIPYTSGASPAVYPIESTTRYRDYFLYRVGMANRTPDPNDSGSLEYNFTSSVESSISTPSTSNYVVGLQTTSGTPINVETITKDFDNPEGVSALNLNKKVAKINTLPQKSIAVRISGSTTGNGSSGSGPFNLYVNGNSIGNIATISFSSTTNFDTTLSIPTSSQGPGMEIYGQFIKYGGDVTEVTFTSGTTMFITSSVASGPTKETIPEPYLTSQFYGGDCDVLLNNVELYRENPFLQDIDYSTDPNTPVNFSLIISGTAARGTVPESYYTALSSINLKYNGSKIQSQDFNMYNPLGFGGLTTTDFGDPINIGTYGQTPSVSSLDANIYEFEWGGGTTPEILDYGAVKMGRILQVSSPEQIQTINPSDDSTQILIPSKRGTTSARARNYRSVVGNPSGQVYPPGSVSTSSIDNVHFWLTSQSISDYTHILKGNNPVNHIISMYMYPNSTAGSNPTLPSTTKILDTDWGVPTISSYALTSSNSSVYGTINSASVPRRFINLSRSIHISKVTTDSNGFYNAGQRIGPNYATIGDQINKDLNAGERWFITLYNEFEFPNGAGDYNSVLTSGSLSPFNEGITQDSYGNYSNALAYKGVYEIAGVYDDFAASALGIMLYNDFPNFGGTKNIGGGAPGNSLGMLIWKARAAGKGEFVLVQDSITGGVQAGAFTSKYVPDYITENFESITKEYGSNQTG